MNTLPKMLESRLKVRFPDCDPFNHLNNAKYIDYIINAREDQLLEFYDLDIHQMARQQGISWVVAQNQISYLFPAYLMETVVVESQLIHYDEKSLLVEARMWDEHKTQLKAVLWTKFVHIDLTNKRSIPHGASLMQLFEQIVAPLTQPLFFEERIASLKPQKV